MIGLHEAIAEWAVERYGVDPGDARYYCSPQMPGKAIMKYLRIDTSQE